MESTVTVRTDEVSMEKLFEMNETFKIRYLVRRHENDYRATVVHGDEIGKKKGIFTYESFLETFHKPFMRTESGKYLPFPQDIEFAIKGLNGGLSPKTVSKVLKIYGSNYCKNENYVKSVMKTDEIRWLVKKIKDEEKTSELSR